jgi:hypothetical protein
LWLLSHRGLLHAACHKQALHALLVAGHMPNTPTAAKLARRGSRREALVRPSQQVVQDLAADEVLAETLVPASEKNAKEWLVAEVTAQLRRLYDAQKLPAPVRSGSALWSRYTKLQTKKGRDKLAEEVETLKEALRTCEAKDLAAVLPLNRSRLDEFRPLVSESICKWIKRCNKRVTSLYLSKQNRAKKAAKGELKAKRAGASVLNPAFRSRKPRKGGARLSRFATQAVRFKTQNKLPAQRATQAVSGAHPDVLEW